MERHSAELIAEAVGSVYEAAYNQALWPQALRSVGNLLGASRACIVRHASDPDGSRFSESVGSYHDPEIGSLAATDDQALDPLVRRMQAQTAGLVYRRRDIVDEDAFRQRSLYQDWMRPRQMDEAANCNLVILGSKFWSLDVSRPGSFGAFDAHEMNLLQLMVPHILRAGQIGETLDGTLAVDSIYRSVPLGLLVADTALNVSHMNPSAEAFLCRADSPLTLRAGRLVTATRRDADLMMKLVAQCCAAPLEGSSDAGGGLILADARGVAGLRLSVTVSRLPPSRIYGLSRQDCAAIMVREIAVRPAGELVSALPGLFNLTPAEAKLTAALVAGKALRQAAADQGIQFSTARHYLELIFPQNQHASSGRAYRTDQVEYAAHLGTGGSEIGEDLSQPVVSGDADRGDDVLIVQPGDTGLFRTTFAIRVLLPTTVNQRHRAGDADVQVANLFDCANRDACSLEGTIWQLAAVDGVVCKAKIEIVWLAHILAGRMDDPVSGGRREIRHAVD